MTHLNIEKISLSIREREKEEQKRTFRKKTLLTLIHHYLEEYGFLQAATALKSELTFPVTEYAICDNIHLESILQDFESYHFLKYQKMPQIMKKIPEDRQKKFQSDKTKFLRSKAGQKTLQLQKDMTELVSNKIEDCIWDKIYETGEHSDVIHNSSLRGDERFLEPLGSFGVCNSEWKSMAKLIMQDVATANHHIQWNAIVGHDTAKQLLREAIVYPIKFNQFFTSVISPWKSVLLYGPSGTGKTLLASAAASESNAVFFKICVSTLISKWRGESEKLLKVLFELAKHYAPSIIFIDEIDSLMSHRGSDHEASRRLKTEFFLQMDMLLSCDRLVLVLAATNMPWDLDYAVLRRLEKRVLISLPSEECRHILFKKFLPHHIEIAKHVTIKTDINYDEILKLTKNYSAADIEIICKEVKMGCLRQAVKMLENNITGKIHLPTVLIEPLKTLDILQAVGRTKPVATDLLKQYAEWKEKHGSE